MFKDASDFLACVLAVPFAGKGGYLALLLGILVAGIDMVDYAFESYSPFDKLTMDIMVDKLIISCKPVLMLT